MSLRTQVLSVALLAGVVAVSSALARSDANTGFTVTSSLDGKTVLPVRSHWIASPQLDSSQGQVAEVDFFIDGYHAWTAHSSPWYFGDNGNWLVTTILQPGLHTFTVRAVVSPDEVAVDKFQARVVAPPKPPGGLAGSWRRAGRTLYIAKAAGRSARTRSLMCATSPTAAPCWDRRSSIAPSSRQPAAPIPRIAGRSCCWRGPSACNSAQSAATPAARASRP
jgi:hypothetical protein